MKLDGEYTEGSWRRHSHKCPTCSQHVSIEGLVLREDQLCSDGREIFEAFAAMVDVGAPTKQGG